MKQSLLSLCILAMAAALSACATGPDYPLLSPVQIAHGFGYSDEALGSDRFTVTYLTPVAHSYGYRYDPQPAEHGARDLALDMAVWRASQIALDKGFKGFHLEDRSSSLDSVHRGGFESFGPPFGPFPYYRGYFGPYEYHGYYGSYEPWRWDYGLDDPPRSTLQAEMRLTIQLRNELVAGDYDAADSIAQLRRTYPQAEGTPPPAPLGAVKPVT